MDIYDTQTLGVVVFGGFMVVSAIGIFLVSTFSMKETSYEEALANQRKEMAKTHHHKVEKKKKEKTVEKKGKTKKKEEKPNGKIPDHELAPNVTILFREPVRAPAMAVAPTPVQPPVVIAPIATVPAMPQEKPASSPKDKKKKEKKVAKVEPAVSSVVNSIQVLTSKSAILETAPKEVPMVAVPPVGAKASTPVTGTAQGRKAEGAQNQGKRAEGAQNLGKKAEGAQNQGKKAEGAQNQGKKAEGPQNQGKKAEGAQNQGKKAEGPQNQGKKAEGAQNQGKKAEGAQNQGKKAEGAQNQGKKAEGAQNQGKKAEGAQNQGKKTEGAQNQGKKVEGAQNQGKKAGGAQNQGKMAEGIQNQGRKADGVQNQGKKAEGTPNQGKKVEGAQNQGKKAEGTPNQGKKAEGTPNQGKNVDGAQNQGKKADGTPNQGRKADGAQNQGKKTEGTPNQGKKGEGTPNQGKKGEGTPNQGKKAEGVPNQGKKVEGAQNQGKKAEGNQNQGKKAEGAQNQGKKGEGTPNQGTKAEGVTNQGKKAEGVPSQGKKAEGTPNQGKKAEGSPSQGKKVDVAANQGKKTESAAIQGKNTDTVRSQEAPKLEAPAKKKSGSKKKGEPGPTDSDSPLYLPYKTLVSTVGSMVFSEGEAQRLIELLSEKAGIIQDTWHKATQKGDPVAILKRQLEEKEKLLATEQEDAAAAKSRLRELNKEMAAEKAKAAAGEAKVKKQLVAREQEITAVQARMQAAYRDHMKEVQQLQGKIRTLQEQLENGPNTQLARLQQENSILRDALNQATSQVESKQNAELAKLRQELNKVNKELEEKLEATRQEEQRRKALETKAATFEKQVLQLQVAHKESEEALQKRLDEVSRELCRTQTSHASLRADVEKAQEQQQQMAELRSKLQSSEAEVRSKCEELSDLHGQLKEARVENSQLTERIRSIEALLEAGQAQDTQASQTEADQQQTRLKELESQVSCLEKEATELREAVEQQKVKNNDLREKNWKAMEALAVAERACEEKLRSLTQAKEDSEKQLHLTEAQTREALLALLPGLSLTAHQNYAEWLQELKEKGTELLKQPSATTEPSSDLASKLREAEETQVTLQAECDQYRTILAETEGMLRDLQKSVEAEEQVWKAKVDAGEGELQKSRATVKHLEETIERLKGERDSSDQVREHLEVELEKHMAAASTECQNYAKEVAGLRQLLLESQSQLDVAKNEAQKQSDELALVRQQLSEMKSHVEDGDVAGSPAASPEAPPAEQDPVELKMQLERTEAVLEDEQTQRHKLTAEFEEAQAAACRLQEELEKLGTTSLESSGTVEAVQLKERLEKEKKLTSDLGRAATKLQELLKTTQEQLAKEKDTVKKLQEQLEKTEDSSSSKEGTSV
ncbi:ribosome-binding protein 1 isoform X4 [Otolemur garnettii]|uniref:ribosome-binding protein 1 isoform X4 n=1 Tax=Otolemur garnettii TaxID=30611 RepID=UPI000643FBFA|nr:ribosome-binding protein 1 isoform X4 [Otolemur garnettii]